jgi:peptidoglycan/LPS O-acetylase OafA/YrhL
MHPTSADASRVNILDPLRGVAALAVAWCHFSATDPINVIKLSGAYGYLGVEVFFVISGFVIPYALSRANYSPGYYPRFLLKRVLRLDPPYIVSILLTLLVLFLRFAAHGFRGEQMQHVSAVQLLLHLGYVNAFFGYAWIIPIYWTLAIEFQFYVSIGILYPLISHRSQWVRHVTLICLGLTYLIDRSGTFIFHYVFLFLLGIVTYQHRNGLLGRTFYLCTVALLLACLLESLGLAITIAGVATALAIAFLDTSGGPLKFFGKISYSVYLTHIIVGDNILDFSLRRVHSTAGRLCLYVIAFGATILCAYLLYRLVERPSQRWSASIPYRREPKRLMVPTLLDTESL